MLLPSLLLACVQTAPTDALAALPLLYAEHPGPNGIDWLVEPESRVAAAYRDASGTQLVLDNGLVRRRFVLGPNAACVGFDDLSTGAALLRSVRPEARIVLEGLEFDVGGLVGQPNHAWFDPAWLEDMRADPEAMQFVGFELSRPQAHLAWPQVRHHAPLAAWPPSGVRLRLDFALPAIEVEQLALHDALGRRVLIEPGPLRLAELERVDSGQHERADWIERADALVLRTPQNAAQYFERALPAETEVVQVRLGPVDDPAKSWGPGIALAFESGAVVKLNLRGSGTDYDAGMAHFGVWDGAGEDPHAGGRQDLDLGQEWELRIALETEAVRYEARPESGSWRLVKRGPREAAWGAPVSVRVGKLDLSGGARDHATDDALRETVLLELAAWGGVDEAGRARAQALADRLARVRVSVNYELYDRLPALSKWLSITHDADRPLLVNDYTVEVLAAVERDSFVEHRGVDAPPPGLHVESDYAMGGMTNENASLHAVRWLEDPQYTTQVNYLRKSPCLLEVGPTNQVLRRIAPGDTLESIRAYELVHDSEDRTRRSLGLARFYETIAPWTTENPLMMHMRRSEDEAVRGAIDQCAEVGFEMVILSFGSGFQMENDAPEYLARMKALADYAHERGIELGGYSLLSSRRIQPDGDNCINPETGAVGGQIHGTTPALASRWGTDYLQTLRHFFEQTGFDLLEHDGPYPGNLDAAHRPPLQHGVEDSRYVNWSLSADLYGWLLARGVYTNAPDWYYLTGTNKCGMGYREVNWSLPRAQQVVHTRQNIFDGTRRKRPSMGWMFVPLTQYHGGGAAATVEPLDEHLDHYESMIASNLGAGVQACYRGPRLYDTPRVRDAVARHVAWYKQWRDVLEAPIVHSASRRADGRELDWMLHADPRLATPGMLVVYNPREEAVQRSLELDLYYTGLRGAARVVGASDVQRTVVLDERGRARLSVELPARGWAWYALQPVESEGR